MWRWLSLYLERPRKPLYGTVTYPYLHARQIQNVLLELPEDLQVPDDKEETCQLKCDKLFLDSIHEAANTIIHRHLEIKMVDHHPDKPYPMDKVYTAAIFLLPGTAAVASTSIASSSPA